MAKKNKISLPLPTTTNVRQPIDRIQYLLNKSKKSAIDKSQNKKPPYVVKKIS
jgi:hypothetical protein